MCRSKVLKLFICILAVILSIFIFFTSFSFLKKEKPLIQPEFDISTNYENYADGSNFFDFSNGKIAWLKKGIFGTKLTVLDNYGKYTTYHSVKSSFRLVDNYIVYLDDFNLKIINTKTNKASVICENVAKFTVIDDEIICLTNYDNVLFRYNIKSKMNITIEKNVKKYFISNNKLFILFDDNLEDLTATIFQISLDDYSKVKITDINNDEFGEIKAYINNALVYTELKLPKYYLTFLNLDTHETSSILLNEIGGAFAISDFVIIGENIYYTFQERATYSEIFWHNENSKYNGVWTINSKTLKRKKISEKTFTDLYVYGEKLLASKGNDIFEINKTGKSITKVING